MIAAVGGYPTDYEFAGWVVGVAMAVLAVAGALLAWGRRGGGPRG